MTANRIATILTQKIHFIPFSSASEMNSAIPVDALIAKPIHMTRNTPLSAEIGIRAP
jgi:hypothetical protein